MAEPADLVGALRPGDTVPDLRSGGRVDVLLAARRVGPGGIVCGLDATPEAPRARPRERGANEYRSLLLEAGFSTVRIATAHQAGDRLGSVLVRATRPGAAPGTLIRPMRAGAMWSSSGAAALWRTDRGGARR